MIVPMPSVAITELTRALVTIRPLIRPISAPTAEDHEDGDRDRQAGVDDQAGDQHALHAGGEADGQVELADDDGDRQPAGDDHGERGLVEHVDAVARASGRRPATAIAKMRDHQAASPTIVP